MATQQFYLRWDNFTNHITTAFGSLRSQEDFVDVTLSCEGKKIRAHKVLLSACSSYFRDVFKDNPCQHPVIVFKNVRYEDLLAIVEFMYQGEVNVLHDALPSFLHTAELLSVQGLTEGGQSNGSSAAAALASQTVLENVQPTSTQIITPKTMTIKQQPQQITLPPQPERRFIRRVYPSTTTATIKTPITLVSSKVISPVKKFSTTPTVTTAGGTSIKTSVPVTTSTTLVADAISPTGGSNPAKRKRFVIDSDENISIEGVNFVKQDDYGMKMELPEFIEIRTADDGKGGTTEITNVVTEELLSTESNPSQENVIIEEVENYDTTNDEDEDHDGQNKSMDTSMEIKYDDESHNEGTVVLTQVIQDDSGKVDDNDKQVLPDGGSVKFRCSVCWKGFRHPMSLTLHRDMHSGKTKCPVCKRSFSRVHDMRTHVSKKHRSSGSGQFTMKIDTEVQVPNQYRTAAPPVASSSKPVLAVTASTSSSSAEQQTTVESVKCEVVEDETPPPPPGQALPPPPSDPK